MISSPPTSQLEATAVVVFECLTLSETNENSLKKIVRALSEVIFNSSQTRNRGPHLYVSLLLEFLNLKLSRLKVHIGLGKIPPRLLGLISG